MIYIYDSMKQVKRLFEFIVDLQKTTHKKLSKMDRRQKATFQMVKEIDSRLRRVEEHLHIPRPPVARHDPDDDDDDDDDNGGNNYVFTQRNNTDTGVPLSSFTCEEQYTHCT